jgi:hypothetical protein
MKPASSALVSRVARMATVFIGAKKYTELGQSS